ncbi:MAG: glycosyltransferase family 2 protein [Limisphaerales bacterium]
MKLSIVMPCLNEHETVGICVEKAVRTLREHGIAGEVVVADNGSTDGSIEIATARGARVVPVADKGYGAALMGGFAAAQGRYILMGDADDSYDFTQAPRFLAKLEEGYDLVQGCRLPSGGGTVMKNAMPFLHRWVGNPGLTWLARTMFGIPVHDIYCGMRGFSRTMQAGLQQRCTGMEFATEMIIKSTLFGHRIGEVPITLHPDGRKSRRPHLRTFRDGWRTLRFFLLFSPRWVFRFPATALLAAGTLGYMLAMTGVSLGGVKLNVQTLLASSIAIYLGVQCTFLGIFVRTYAQREGLLPMHHGMSKLAGWLQLERFIMLGLLGMMAGIGLMGIQTFRWYQTGFGYLDLNQTGRVFVPGACLFLIGISVILNGFCLSVFSLATRKSDTRKPDAC